MNTPDPALPSPTVTTPEADVPKLGEPTPPNTLTPEEQMAKFEEDLKFNDWGHQPC